MKKTCLISLGLALAGTLFGDILADSAASGKLLEQKQTEYAAKQEELRALRQTAQTLETTAKVTLDPAAGPKEETAAPTLVYSNPLTSLKGFDGQKGKAEEAELPDGKAIRIDAPGAESICRYITVPENGATFRVSVSMKAENVVRKSDKYFSGTRLGAQYQSGEKSYWPAAPAGVGSFDWRPVSFQFTAPAGCRNFRLILGMSGATGTVWVRNLRVETL